MPELLIRLHREHADFPRLLDLLERQLALFTAGDDADYDVIGATLRYCLEYPDAVHHPKEDLIYGGLRSRNPAFAAEVGGLEEDHVGLAEATRELAGLIERGPGGRTGGPQQCARTDPRFHPPLPLSHRALRDDIDHPTALAQSDQVKDS